MTFRTFALITISVGVLANSTTVVAQTDDDEAFEDDSDGDAFEDDGDGDAVSEGAVPKAGAEIEEEDDWGDAPEDEVAPGSPLKRMARNKARASVKTRSGPVNTRRRFEISALAGGAVFVKASEPRVSLRSSGSFGLRFGYLFDNDWFFPLAVEAELSVIPTVERGGGTGALSSSWLLGARAEVFSNRQVASFTTLAAGLVTSSRADPMAERDELLVAVDGTSFDAVVAVGVGWRWAVTESVGVGLDVRGIYSPLGQDEFSTTRLDALATGYFRFGDLPHPKRPLWGPPEGEAGADDAEVPGADDAEGEDEEEPDAEDEWEGEDEEEPDAEDEWEGDDEPGVGEDDADEDAEPEQLDSGPEQIPDEDDDAEDTASEPTESEEGEDDWFEDD